MIDVINAYESRLKNMATIKDKTLKIDEENGITFSIEEYKTKG